MLPLVPFYLIRHGESEANAANKAAGGNLDSPLTATGRLQASNLAARIDSLPHKPYKIYHSPLSRAADTAVILNNVLKLDCESHADIREHSMGAWAGMRTWKDCITDLENGVFPTGGESFNQLDARVLQAFRTILLNSKQEQPCVNPISRIPLIVAHGGIFQALGRLLSLNLPEIHNCEIYYFEPTNDDGAQEWRAKCV